MSLRQPHRPTLASYTLRSALRGCSTEVRILQDHFLAVQCERPRQPPKKFTFDMSFASPKKLRPAPTLATPASWLVTSTELVRSISGMVTGERPIAPITLGRVAEAAEGVASVTGTTRGLSGMSLGLIRSIEAMICGGSIRGKPTLWLPLDTTPKKVGRYRMTPERYRQEIGPLALVKHPGRKPLLFGKMEVSARQAQSGALGKVTLPKLRKGAAKSGIVRAVPLFVGVDSVKIRDRFSINEIVDKAIDRMGEVFVRKLDAKDID